MAVAVLLLYFAAAYFSASLLVLLILPFFWLLRGVYNPIIIDYVQRIANSSERATVLSINALAGRLVFSITSPFLGWTADVWSLQVAFLCSGVIFGCLTLIGVAGLLVSRARFGG